MCQAIFDSLKHVILLNQAILNRNRHCIESGLNSYTPVQYVLYPVLLEHRAALIFFPEQCSQLNTKIHESRSYGNFRIPQHVIFSVIS